MYRFHLRKCSFFFSWSAWVSPGRFARVLSWLQMRKKPGIDVFFSKFKFAGIRERFNSTTFFGLFSMSFFLFVVCWIHLDDFMKLWHKPGWAGYALVGSGVIIWMVASWSHKVVYIFCWQYYYWGKTSTKISLTHFCLQILVQSGSRGNHFL